MMPRSHERFGQCPSYIVERCSFQQRPQDKLQDTVVSVVINLIRGINAGEDGECLDRSIFPSGLDGEFLPGLEPTADSPR